MHQHKANQDPVAGRKWLENTAVKRLIEDEEMVEKTLQKHPFNLKRFYDHYPNSSPLPIHYLRVMQTFLLVDPMTFVVARELKYNDDWSDVEPIRGLRVIYTEEWHDKNKHRIFYEVAGIEAVYMVGHSTDYSGHGRKCHERLGNLFAYLSKRFGLKIDEATIPYHQARPFVKSVNC